VNDYEVGLKSKWLNDTLLLNLNLFRGDYTDLQVSASRLYTDPVTGQEFGIPFIGNAAKSRSQGVELEGQWVPAKGFSFGVNVTYLNAHFVSYPNSAQTTVQGYCATTGAGTPYCIRQFPRGVPVVDDLSGQATPYAPRWSGSLNVVYGIMLPGDLRFTTELDPYFTTEYSTVSGDPIYRIGGYVRLDGRLALGPEHGRWSIDLIGKNLTDRTIVTYQDVYTFTKEQPRNVALQFRYHF